MCGGGAALGEGGGHRRPMKDPNEDQRARALFIGGKRDGCIVGRGLRPRLWLCLPGVGDSELKAELRIGIHLPPGIVQVGLDRTVVLGESAGEDCAGAGTRAADETGRVFAQDTSRRITRKILNMGVYGRFIPSSCEIAKHGPAWLDTCIICLLGEQLQEGIEVRNHPSATHQVALSGASV